MSFVPITHYRQIAQIYTNFACLSLKYFSMGTKIAEIAVGEELLQRLVGRQHFKRFEGTPEYQCSNFKYFLNGILRARSIASRS